MKKALFKLQSASTVYKQQQKLIYTSFQWNNFVKSGKLFGKLIIVFLSDYQFLTGKEKNHIKKILQNSLFSFNQISHAAFEF